MQMTYSQKNDIAQKKDAPTAASVLDTSSQSESLQRKADMANNVAQREEAPRPNNTGMPDNLKAGIESLSGFSMDDVRVYYNSSKPATVQALAYTQGTDIHVAPGQEKHLPHEAWHVAQQMAGRVSPTTNINGMPVNDNAGLEHEADVMGEKAVQRKECLFYSNNTPICASVHPTNHNKTVAQCMFGVRYEKIANLATLNVHLGALNPVVNPIALADLQTEIRNLIIEFCEPLTLSDLFEETKLNDLENDLLDSLIEKTKYLTLYNGIERKVILDELKKTIVYEKDYFFGIIQQNTPYKRVGADIRLSEPGGFKQSGQDGKFYGNTKGWHIHEYTDSSGVDGHVKTSAKNGMGAGLQFSFKDPKTLIAAIDYIRFYNHIDENAKVCFAYLRYHFWISTGRVFDISDNISGLFS